MFYKRYDPPKVSMLIPIKISKPTTAATKAAISDVAVCNVIQNRHGSNYTM